MKYTYPYPRPAVTADILIIVKNNSSYKLLLIQRKNDPYKDYWAFPGGFLNENESLESAAARELEEETSLKNIELHQFKTYSKYGRDPRAHVITTIFYAILDKDIVLNAIAGDDAKDFKWIDINTSEQLAFDHNEILDEFRKKFMKRFMSL